MKRVVVTGLGAVTPLGVGVQNVWDRLIDGKSGITPVSTFDVSDLPAKIAGMVPRGTKDDGAFDPEEWVEKKELKKMDTFIAFALAAAAQAVEDSGWRPDAEEDLDRTGVMIGSGIGGLAGISEGSVILETRGPRRMSPFFIPASLINLASGYVSIVYGFRGPNHAVVTACATGTHAIGDAARLIMFGDADVMLAGGTEAAVCRIGMAGFAASRALSTNFNDTPERASRPWDKGRALSFWKNWNMPRHGVRKFMPRSWDMVCRAMPTISRRHQKMDQAASVRCKAPSAMPVSVLIRSIM